jgi:hypothetical protein
MPSFSDDPGRTMPSAGDAIGAVFFANGQGYFNYIFRAQQELLQLSANLLQREIDVTKKLTESGDMAGAFAACGELMRETVQDFTGATARLLDQATATQSRAADRAQEGAHEVTRVAKEGVQAAADQTTASLGKVGEAAASGSRAAKAGSKS